MVRKAEALMNLSPRTLCLVGGEQRAGMPRSGEIFSAIKLAFPGGASAERRRPTRTRKSGGRRSGTRSSGDRREGSTGIRSSSERRPVKRRPSKESRKRKRQQLIAGAAATALGIAGIAAGFHLADSGKSHEPHKQPSITNSKSVCPPGNTLRNFECHVLLDIGTKPRNITQADYVSMDAWQRAEASNARHNPWDDERPAPGATDYNSAHVKNYASRYQGERVTAATLENGSYPDLLDRLRSGKGICGRLHGLKVWSGTYDQVC